MIIKYLLVFEILLFVNLINLGVSNDVNDNSIETVKLVSEDDYREYRERYAQEMLSFMDLSIDPCDDFYEYACGNYKNVIEERFDGKRRHNLLDIAYKIVDIVEELLDKPNDDFPLEYKTELNLAQKFYRSCLEADLYPPQPSQDYLYFINEIGGFPAVDSSWDADNFDWFNMSAHLNVYDVNALINEHQYRQYPFPPGFKLPELGFEYYVHSDNIASQATRGYELNAARMRRYLTLYGVEEPKVTEVISGVFDFWYSVLGIMDVFNEDWGMCKNISAEWNEDERFQRWDNYMDIVWQGTDFSPEYNGTCPCDYFYVELDKICNQHKEAVANYLAMKFLYAMDADLKGEQFQKKYCVTEIKTQFPFIIGKLYLAKYYNEQIEDDVRRIIKEIHKILHYVIEHADFLDDETREQALIKESLIVERVGYLKDLDMIDKLIREMNNVDFVEGKYDCNHINLKKFGAYMERYSGFHYDEMTNDSAPIQLLDATITNGFYYIIDNSINIMAGLLHPPAYHMAWPNSLKFGALGFLIGHEFTHGFDATGRIIDKDGKERNWWSKESEMKFKELSKCYVDRFSDYLVPEINRYIDGNRTLDENIADGGGLRQSLYAYRQYIESISKDDTFNILKDEHMPGIDLNPEQLFFVGFAQLWCASYKEEHYWKELRDEHTIDKFRVLGALSNFNEFAEVYACPLGSQMHSNLDKCKIW